MSPDPGRPISPDVRAMGAAELFARCAQNTDDSALWSEFVRRFAPRIKAIIRGTLRQSLPAGCSLALGGTHENDLFQSTVVRQVENGCALMKRFSGSSEDELVVYLAVITRSVVRDCLKRNRAQKRLRSESQLPLSDAHRKATWEAAPTGGECAQEKELLVREVRHLCLRVIESQAEEFCRRDRAGFLYFIDYFCQVLNKISQRARSKIPQGFVQKIIFASPRCGYQRVQASGPGGGRLASRNEKKEQGTPSHQAS